MKDYQGSLLTLATGDNINMDKGVLEKKRTRHMKL